MVEEKEKQDQEKQEQELQLQEKDILKKVESIQITSLQTLEAAVLVTQDIKIGIKKAEEFRKFFVQPLNDQVKRINKKFKPFITRLEEAESTVKSKMQTYQAEQEEIRRKEEARIRKEQEEQFKKDLKKAKKNKEDAPSPPLPPKVKDENVLGLSFTTKWTFKILDINKIPRGLMLVDEKKIRKQVQAGIRKIAGVQIYQEKIPTVRTDSIDDI